MPKANADNNRKGYNAASNCLDLLHAPAHYALGQKYFKKEMKYLKIIWIFKMQYFIN